MAKQAVAHRQKGVVPFHVLQCTRPGHSMKFGHIQVSLTVFLVVFLVHALSPVVTSYDSRWTVHTALSLFREGNLDLDEYEELLHAANDYAVVRYGGHAYSYFSPGTSILGLPLIVAADKSLALAAGHVPYLLPRAALGAVGYHEQVEHLVASFLVALTSVVVFLVVRERVALAPALLLTFLFAFCTSAWSTASRALWQHGPSMLMLALALYAAMRARARPRWVMYMGLPLAFSYLVRPSNAIAIACFTVYVALEHRRWVWGYLLAMGLVLASFFILNMAVYNAWLPPYYDAGRLGWHPRLFEALAGNLVSPARGLFVYSPVFIFSIAGVFLALRARQFSRLDGCIVAILLLHWLVISAFSHWWGGHCYGPRFFADMAPFLVYLIVPVVEVLPGVHGMKGWLVRCAFALCVVLSFAIHSRGALTRAVYDWNTQPSNIDEHPERLWDWNDAPFLRSYE